MSRSVHNDLYRYDCRPRATLPTAELEGLVYIAFNGDTMYSDYVAGESNGFVGYLLELKTQDHRDLLEGGLQLECSAARR